MAAPLAANEDAPKPRIAPPSQAGKDEEQSEPTWTWQVYVPLTIFFCMVVGAGLLVYTSWSTFVDLLFEAVEASEHKLEQALVINSVLVLMIVCCLPGPGFCIMLDGFFFGFLKGFALAFIAELIGYLICICLARTCFKSQLRSWGAGNERLSEVLAVLEEDSTGKFLVLFRFISLPVWLKNYAIGMLEISYLKAILVFVPGEAFYCGIFSYIGSKGHDIATAMRKGETHKAFDSFSGMEVIIFCVSILGLILMIALGWREYLIRRSAIVEGARDEAAPLMGAKKPIV